MKEFIEQPTSVEGEFQICEKDEPEEFATFRLEPGPLNLLKLHGVYENYILISPNPNAIFGVIFAGG